MNNSDIKVSKITIILLYAKTNLEKYFLLGKSRVFFDTI
jgi:hypothetical protein